MTKAYLLEDKSTELSLVNIEMGIQEEGALCPGCIWDTSLGKWSLGVYRWEEGRRKGNFWQRDHCLQKHEDWDFPVAQCLRP